MMDRAQLQFQLVCCGSLYLVLLVHSFNSSFDISVICSLVVVWRLDISIQTNERMITELMNFFNYKQMVANQYYFSVLVNDFYVLGYGAIFRSFAISFFRNGYC
ncbi:hypothetical protein D3C85_1020280 [compost metagenome]